MITMCIGKHKLTRLIKLVSKVQGIIHPQLFDRHIAFSAINGNVPPKKGNCTSYIYATDLFIERLTSIYLYCSLSLFKIFNMEWIIHNHHKNHRSTIVNVYLISSY